MYRAAAALPYNDRERATAGLRGQLQLMAATVGGTADWATLEVAGPVEAAGRHAVLFEWTATVTVDGVEDQPDDAALDAALPAARPPTDPLPRDSTAPFAAMAAG